MKKYKDRKILMSDRQWKELGKSAKKVGESKSALIRESLKVARYTT